MGMGSLMADGRGRVELLAIGLSVNVGYIRLGLSATTSKARSPFPIQPTTTMRSRDRILANLESIYRESYDQASGSRKRAGWSTSKAPTCVIS